MAAKQFPGLEEIAPGLYVSTDLENEGELTREYAEAVRRYSRSNVLADIIEEAVRKRESRQSVRKK